MVNKQTLLIKARQVRKLWQEYVDLYIKLSLNPEATPAQVQTSREALIRMYHMTIQIEKSIAEVVSDPDFEAKILRFNQRNRTKGE